MQFSQNLKKFLGLFILFFAFHDYYHYFDPILHASGRLPNSNEKIVQILYVYAFPILCGVICSTLCVLVHVQFWKENIDIDCLQKLDKRAPHQFAKVFQAAKKKKRDILSCNEAMTDHADLKAWPAAALKEM